MLLSLAGVAPCAASCIGQSAWAVVVALSVEECAVAPGIGASVIRVRIAAGIDTIAARARNWAPARAFARIAAGICVAPSSAAWAVCNDSPTLS